MSSVPTAAHPKRRLCLAPAPRHRTRMRATANRQTAPGCVASAGGGLGSSESSAALPVADGFRLAHRPRGPGPRDASDAANRRPVAFRRSGTSGDGFGNTPRVVEVFQMALVVLRFD